MRSCLYYRPVLAQTQEEERRNAIALEDEVQTLRGGLQVQTLQRVRGKGVGG